MNKKNKPDIVLFSKGYFVLVAFFLMMFLAILTSFIYLYIIEKRHIQFAFFLSIVFMIVFGGIALFIYSLYGSKVRVYGNIIAVRKWYKVKKVFDINCIENIIFEKSEGEIVSVQIISEVSNDKFFDEKINFDKLCNYLIDNVNEDKFKCYVLGTKKECALKMI